MTGASAVGRSRSWRPDGNSSTQWFAHYRRCLDYSSHFASFLLSESSCAVHAICRYTASHDLFKVEIVTENVRTSTITSDIDAWKVCWRLAFKREGRSALGWGHPADIHTLTRRTGGVDKTCVVFQAQIDTRSVRCGRQQFAHRIDHVRGWSRSCSSTVTFKKNPKYLCELLFFSYFWRQCHGHLHTPTKFYGSRWTRASWLPWANDTYLLPL